MSDFENTDDSAIAQSALQKRLERELDEPIFSNPAVARCVEAYERAYRGWMKQLTEEAPNLNEEISGEGQDEDDENDDNIQAELEAAAKVASIGLKAAGEAYRTALPPLTGAVNIRNFVACVAHGMVLNVFQPSEGSKLLYAAQVAAFAESKRYRSGVVV